MQHQPELQLKIAIRRLPPKLPEEIFRKVISQFVSVDGEHCDIDYFRFVPGKAKAIGNPLQPEQHSVAYMRFLMEDKLLEFTKLLNGWKFQSKSGDVHFAAVEYAPNQAVPMENQHDDPLEGTILKDPMFLDFVDELHRGGLETVLRVEEPKISDDLGASKMTPLLEYLNRRRQKQIQGSQNHQQQQGKSKKGSKQNKPAQILKRNVPEQSGGTSAAGERDPNTKKNSSKKKGKSIGQKKKAEGSASTITSQIQPNQQQQQSSQEGQSKKPKKKRYPKKNKPAPNNPPAPM